LGVEGFAGNDSRNVLDCRDEVKSRLNAGFACKTTAELMQIFVAEDIWAAPVNRFPDVERDPQVQHNRTIVSLDHPVAGKFRTIGPPVRFSRTPSGIRRPPLLGEHTDEILADLGYTKDEVAEFKTSQVV